jgi:hypothetical protein
MPKSVPALNATYQPQQWIHDNATDSEPARAFDAAPVLLSMNADQFRTMNAEIRKDHGRDLDLIAEAAGAGVTRGHTGPFEVRINSEEYLAWLEKLGFDPHDITSLDDAVIEKMRAEYNVAQAPASRGDLIASASMVDWRVGDGEADQLSDLQKRERLVMLIRNSDSLLFMEVENPDGTKHVVGFEFDRGNFRILTYPNDQDEVAAIVSLTSEGLHIASGSEDQNFVVDEKGIRGTWEQAPASFADAPTPKP